MESNDLNQLENQIYQEYEKDGCVEFLMGFGLFFASAILEGRGRSSFAVFIPLLIIIFKKAWKKGITYPRLGYAKFNEFRALRRKREVITIIAVGLACIGIIIAGAFTADSVFSNLFFNEAKPFSRLIFAAVIPIIILSVAAIRRFTALYYAGALAFLLIIAGHFMGFSPGIAVLITSFALMATGLVRLVQFIKANPKLKDSGAGDLHA